MTDHENYRKTFDAVASSKMRTLEAEQIMVTRTRRKKSMNKMAVVFAAVFLFASLSCVAYAANIGGIREIVRVWLHGEQKDAEFTYNPEGSYQLVYEGEDGEQHEISGGGVAIEPDGSERPLTADELMEQLVYPDIDYDADGKAYLYYKDQKIDITDKFENEFCYFELQDGDTTLYVTAKYKAGFAISPEGYSSPDNFED